MSFEKEITIKEAVEKIREKRFLIPALQRGFVWEEDKIVCLFDSLMRDYPIGTFLSWDVPKTENERIGFYDFICDYHERDRKWNEKANVDKRDEIIGVLDGQQRLTALNIGLRGNMWVRPKHKKKHMDSSYINKFLYLDILNEPGENELELEYNFRFLTEKEASDKSSGGHWFKVSEIVEFDGIEAVTDYLNPEVYELDKTKRSFATKRLSKLFNIVHVVRTISFSNVKEPDMDKVLNIFVRLNTGGIPLSKSDYFLSLATNEWNDLDAREEIYQLERELNREGGFKFNKDFILKACLALGDAKSIGSSVYNIKSEMKGIEEKWSSIKESVVLTLDLIKSLGFNGNNLASNNAIIPIAYYLHKHKRTESYVLSGKFKDDRANIHEWLNIVILKKSFGGKSDSLMQTLRDFIFETNLDRFPLQELREKYKTGEKNFTISEDDAEELLDLKYTNSYAYTVLALLYPWVDFSKKPDIDHIFPKSIFGSSKELNALGIPKEDHDFYKEKAHSIGNLRLATNILNREKGKVLPQEWIVNSFPHETARKQFLDHEFMQALPLEPKQFRRFIEGRELNLKAAILKIAGRGKV